MTVSLGVRVSWLITDISCVLVQFSSHAGDMANSCHDLLFLQCVVFIWR